MITYPINLIKCQGIIWWDLHHNSQPRSSQGRTDSRTQAAGWLRSQLSQAHEWTSFNRLRAAYIPKTNSDISVLKKVQGRDLASCGTHHASSSVIVFNWERKITTDCGKQNSKTWLCLTTEKQLSGHSVNRDTIWRETDQRRWNNGKKPSCFRVLTRTITVGRFMTSLDLWHQSQNTGQSSIPPLARSQPTSCRSAALGNPAGATGSTRPLWDRPWTCRLYAHDHILFIPSPLGQQRLLSHQLLYLTLTHSLTDWLTHQRNQFRGQLASMNDPFWSMLCCWTAWSQQEGKGLLMWSCKKALLPTLAMLHHNWTFLT